MVRFYNKRGTAEQWIKEGKQAVKDDAAVVSSIPGQRSALAVELVGLQPGEPVAAAVTGGIRDGGLPGERVAKKRRRDGGVSENCAETRPKFPFDS